jgi:hypothetical protein
MPVISAGREHEAGKLRGQDGDCLKKIKAGINI